MFEDAWSDAAAAFCFALRAAAELLFSQQISEQTKRKQNKRIVSLRRSVTAEKRNNRRCGVALTWCRISTDGLTQTAPLSWHKLNSDAVDMDI